MRFAAYFSLLVALIGCASNAGRSQTVDFRVFVREFFSSEDFQADHIRFPLESVTLDYETSDFTSEFISKAEWNFAKGPAYFECEKSCYDIMIYDTFSKHQESSGKRVLAFEGAQNGINSSMYFQLVDGKWYLVKVEDFNN